MDYITNFMEGLTMYTKEVITNFFDDGTTTNFYKNGMLIASRKNSEPIKFYHRYYSLFDPITRAKGYRYWEKHFPNRACYALPKLLEDAVYLEAEYKVTVGDCAYYG